MFSIKSGRVLVAAALVAFSFFLAVPAEAADSRGGPELLGTAAKVVGALGDWFQGMLASMTGSAGLLDHEGPYVDPNGRHGSCTSPTDCGEPQPNSPSPQDQA